MKVKTLVLWENLRTSFWFVPALMVAGAIILAFATVALDQWVGFDLIDELGIIYTGGPEGARSLLSTVAGSAMSVAGVTFSITITALTLASGQFGPHLLRNFVRDTGNQVVLGTFIATFIYCLLVLRTVRGLEDRSFVPYIAVTVAIVLAVASVAVLIYFIHHIAESIQAEYVIVAVSQDLEQAVERIFAESIGCDRATQGPAAPDIPPSFDQEAQTVLTDQTGYMQRMDAAGLIELAREHDLLIKLLHRPGGFVVAGGALARAWPPEHIDADLADKLRGLFAIGLQSTQRGNVEFAIAQLVQIAVRALSPGVNDPFTAMMCIDRLGAALCRVAEHPIPSALRYDNNGKLRVIADVVTFPNLVHAAFDQIRHYGSSSPAVLTRMLAMLASIATRTDNPIYQRVLLHQATLIERGSKEGLPDAYDQQGISEHYQRVVQVTQER